MAQIFLSYRRSDKVAADQVAAYLIAQGYDVWWDMDLLAGQQFAREIERVIDDSEATIVLWSENAVQSDFVRAEARRALDLGKLVPCTIDDVRIPIPFTEIHTARLISSDGNITNLSELDGALRSKGISPVGPRVSNEAATNQIAEPSEWQLFWYSVSSLRPESVDEYQKFLDLYSEQAPSQIGSLAKRRMQALSASIPIWKRKSIYAAAAGIIATVAAGLQISDQFFGETIPEIDPDPIPAVVELIQAPDLIMPSNNNVFESVTEVAMLHWSHVEGRKKYNVEIQQLSPTTKQWGMLPNYPLSVKQEFFTLKFPSAGKGRWRVIAVGNENQESNPSDWRYFEYEENPVKLVSGPSKKIEVGSNNEESRQFGQKVEKIILSAQGFEENGEYQRAIDKLFGARKQPGLSTYEIGTIEQMLGGYYYEIEDLPKAIVHFENAINSDGLTKDEIVSLDNIVAQLLIANGHYKMGADRLANWVEQNGESPKNVEFVMQGYVQADEYALALPWAEKWFQNSDPKERKHYDLLYFLYNELELKSQQLSLLEEMIDKWPSDQSLKDWAVENGFDLVVSDRDVQPLVRFPGVVPDSAIREGKSGHCKIRFDVNAWGAPFNIDAFSCSHSMFEHESIRAVTKFEYAPKLVNGIAVVRRGVETKITYRVTDELGNILPE